MLVDTHCHIHSDEFGIDAEEAIEKALDADVKKMICVGTDVDDSKKAASFARTHQNVWASVGIHPHEATKDADRIEHLDQLIAEDRGQSIVAIGEIGLDYYYEHSPREVQIQILHNQLEIAKAHSLPVIFHVRDAFDDFWEIFDQHPGLKGVIHSFSAGRTELEQIVERGLYAGLNGIMTFTKHAAQLDAMRRVPLENMLLETDAPFLTPVPNRGKVNSPHYLVDTAVFLAKQRGESLERIQEQTTRNAETLFSI